MPRSPLSLVAATLAVPRRLVDRIRWIGGRQDDAFEAAAREAYRTGTDVDAATRAADRPPLASASSALSRPSVQPNRLPADAIDGAPVDSLDRSMMAPAQMSSAAPSDMLFRTRSNVAPVSDDFFESLIRRVEGDH
jgi:hypothetical protein